MTGRRRRPMNRIPNDFAVIFGTDHHSYPDALNRTIQLGLRDVFHFGAGHDWSAGDFHSFRFTYSLSHIALGSIAAPLETKNDNRETDAVLDKHAARRLLSLPWCLEDCCFAGAPERSIFEMNARELADFHKDLAQRLGIDAGRIRVVIVPDWKAGCCRCYENRVEVQPRQRGRPPGPVRMEPAAVYFVSPGNCRAHVFSTFNTTTREIHWHDCS